MPSRKIEDLHPRLQPIARQFLAECEAAGLDILITCTYRSPAEQTALYEQGRTKPGAIVTYARAGQSKHNAELNGKPASLAFDIVPLENGKAQWSKSHPAWLKAAAVGKRLGLSWAGDWVRFKEWPHFELA
jgi:peptidoglycan L-alanyl-D-glutamate endopeptidase CwlK